jgi:peptidoglycan/LPS O-acetylase OafA/YrhL
LPGPASPPGAVTEVADSLAPDPAAAPPPSPAFAPPPGNPRFPLLDGLRGFAVLGILSYHTAQLTGRIGFGPLGRASEVAGNDAVVIFFVISSFLLYRPYALARATGRRAPTVRRYARRRVMRILPAYWSALTLLAIFPGIAGVFSGDWWRYYGYLQIYSHSTYIKGIPQAWTLCVELPFYAAVPLWAASVRRLGKARGAAGRLRSELWPVAILGLGGLAVQLIAAHGDITTLLATAVTGQSSWLALGMALAAASVAVQVDDAALLRVRALAERPGLCWLASAAAFVALMFLVPSGGLFGIVAQKAQPQSVARTLLTLVLEGIQAVTLVLPAVFGDQRTGLPRRFLSTRPLLRLGVLSYSFYLWHFTIAMFIGLPRATPFFSADGLGLLEHVHRARTAVLFIATLGVTWAVASISYRFIELPFLTLKERRKA